MNDNLPRLYIVVNIHGYKYDRLSLTVGAYTQHAQDPDAMVVPQQQYNQPAVTTLHPLPRPTLSAPQHDCIQPSSMSSRSSHDSPRAIIIRRRRSSYVLPPIAISKWATPRGWSHVFAPPMLQPCKPMATSDTLQRQPTDENPHLP